MQLLYDPESWLWIHTYLQTHIHTCTTKPIVSKGHLPTKAHYRISESQTVKLLKYTGCRCTYQHKRTLKACDAKKKKLDRKDKYF